jgi:hypothetical protein
VENPKHRPLLGRCVLSNRLCVNVGCKEARDPLKAAPDLETLRTETSRALEQPISRSQALEAKKQSFP